MKKIKIFGMTIKDYPLKESLNVTRSFLHSTGLQTISYISRDVLMSVADYPYQKEWLEDLDLVLFEEPIEADSQNVSNVTMATHDGKNDDYLLTLFNSMAASGVTAYILADNEERLDRLEKMIGRINSRLKIVSKMVYSQERMEYIFNDINSKIPDVIFSCSEWGIQGPLMRDGKRMLCAKMWMGFLPSFLEDKKKGLIGNIEEKIAMIRFMIRVKKYHNMKNYRKNSEK